MAHQRQVCHKGSAILAYISYKRSCITATRLLLHGFRVAYAGEYRASGDSPGLIGELTVPRHLSSPGSLLFASLHGTERLCVLSRCFRGSRHTPTCRMERGGEVGGVNSERRLCRRRHRSIEIKHGAPG